MPVDRGTHKAVEARFQAWDPRCAIAHTRRARFPRAVAFDASCLDDVFAGSVRHRTRAAAGLNPVPPGLIDHVGNGALELDIRQREIAPMRRHVADTFESVRGKRAEPLRATLGPCCSVSDPRRAVEPRTVTLDAHLVHDLLTGALDRFGSSSPICVSKCQGYCKGQAPVLNGTVSSRARNPARARQSGVHIVSDLNRVALRIVKGSADHLPKPGPHLGDRRIWFPGLDVEERVSVRRSDPRQRANAPSPCPLAPAG